MKHKSLPKAWLFGLICLLLSGNYRAVAQVIVYTDVFTNGVQCSPAQVAAWNAFRTSLVPLPYYKVKVTGSVGPTVKECNDPAIVQDIALKLSTLPGPVTTNAFSWVDGPNTWQVGTDISGRLGVNMTSLSNCDNPGHVVKPGIANLNWGGWGTATCGGPTQTITVEFWYGPPCPVPTGLGVSALTSKTATVSWNAVAGSTGYEYVVDQNAGNPAAAGAPTLALTANVSGLTPSTNYYLHVRNKCVAPGISQWVHFPFTTLPPCQPPIGFHTTNLQPVSATINWAVWPSAISYDYLVDQNRADPIGSTGVLNTVATSAPAPGLTENTWYYVHLRSKCAASEESGWGLDSFITPIVCRAPDVKIDHIYTEEAVAYWDAVPTAYEYEYAINTSATPPAIGTKYKYTSIHTSALKDGAEYFIHLRSHCESVGAFTSSDWRTVSFKTIPTAISTVAGPGVAISCYPNPVTSLLQVGLSGYGNVPASLSVCDMAGRVIITTEVTGKKVVVDMQDLPGGVYMVKYADVNGYRAQSLVHKK